MLVTIILDGGREVSILQKKSEQVKSKVFFGTDFAYIHSK